MALVETHNCDRCKLIIAKGATTLKISKIVLERWRDVELEYSMNSDGGEFCSYQCLYEFVNMAINAVINRGKGGN